MGGAQVPGVEDPVAGVTRRPRLLRRLDELLNMNTFDRMWLLPSPLDVARGALSEVEAQAEESAIFRLKPEATLS